MKTMCVVCGVDLSGAPAMRDNVTGLFYCPEHVGVMGSIDPIALASCGACGFRYSPQHSTFAQAAERHCPACGANLDEAFEQRGSAPQGTRERAEPPSSAPATKQPSQAEENAEPDVWIMCAECHASQQVPFRARGFKCAGCGVEFMWAKCPGCGNRLQPRREWKRSKCQRCGREFDTPTGREPWVSEITDLEALQARLELLPTRYLTKGQVVSYGPGPQEQIPIICRNIADAVKALRTGRDANGTPITASQVGTGLENLVTAVSGPAFTGGMSLVLGADGVREFESSINKLASVATSLRGARDAHNGEAPGVNHEPEAAPQVPNQEQAEGTDGRRRRSLPWLRRTPTRRSNVDFDVGDRVRFNPDAPGTATAEGQKVLLRGHTGRVVRLEGSEAVVVKWDPGTYELYGDLLFGPEGMTPVTAVSAVLGSFDAWVHPDHLRPEPDHSTTTPDAASVNEMFEQIVDPWEGANLSAGEPDWAALANAVAPYPAEWRAAAWQDVGREQWHFGGKYPRAAGDWVPIAQCYVEALRHNRAPNFLGWDVFTGGGPEDDPEAEALKKRIAARSDLSDADRAQLVDDLRRYVGAPGDPGPADA
ncbi:MAG TPA: hypothetical protein VMK12_30360 [Anaeromyxobacteraceae bacterium]|nr:hypothetical protein [Anaeromyxobacteraceae bacterium]